jgi:hypothetical protein
MHRHVKHAGKERLSLRTLCTLSLSTTITLTRPHPAWTSQHITYGLYLSDQRILSDIETELTVLAGIMMQNLPRETAWHLRGTRRIGVSLEDTETVQQCVSWPCEDARRGRLGCGM